MNIFFRAIVSIFRERTYLVLFLLLCPFVFSLFVLIPVRAIPGNDLKFQLSIFTLRDYAVLIALTLLIALSLTMQMYLFRRTKTSRKKTAALSGGVTGVAGSFSGVLATVFATASCSSCAAALLGFLGSGAVLFLVENRWWMTLATTTLLLISLYVSAKKVLGVCVRCEISLSPNRSLPKEERALRSSKRT